MAQQPAEVEATENVTAVLVETTVTSFTYLEEDCEVHGEPRSSIVLTLHATQFVIISVISAIFLRFNRRLALFSSPLSLLLDELFFPLPLNSFTHANENHPHRTHNENSMTMQGQQKVSSNSHSFLAESPG